MIHLINHGFYADCTAFNGKYSQLEFMRCKVKRKGMSLVETAIIIVAVIAGAVTVVLLVSMLT